MQSAAAVMAVLVLGAGCGEGGGNSSSSHKADLRIVLPGTQEPVRTASYDFGAVAVGSQRQVKFELQNVGSDFGRIIGKRFEEAPPGAFYADPRPSDGLAPGAIGELTLTFVPSLVPGPNDAPYGGRFILEHDGDSLSVTINVSGTGVP